MTKGLTESFAGKTFEVFTRFKPNLVCPLGWSADGAHQLQSKKMIHSKLHLTVKHNSDGKAIIVGLYLILYTCRV